jgi:hypothetical protein
MYYLNPSKGNGFHGVFCWKRNANENLWTAYNKYGEQVDWPSRIDDKMVGFWLNNYENANLSYSVVFEKREVWPKVAENWVSVAIFDDANSLARKVYVKDENKMTVGKFSTYSQWCARTKVTELHGEVRERWVRFFQ